MALDLQAYKVEGGAPGQYAVMPFAGNHPQGYTPVDYNTYNSNVSDTYRNLNSQAYPQYGPNGGQIQGTTLVNGVPMTDEALKGMSNANQQEYNTQLASALKSGTQPAQIAPGVANPNIGLKDTATNPPPSKFEQGFNQANQGGAPTPKTPSDAQAVISSNVSGDQSNPTVDSFFSDNPNFQGTSQQLMDFLNPKTTQDTLNNYLSTLQTDKATLSGLNTQLMNVQNVISGTEQNIRDEVTKAGGFATDSQVKALAIARNKTLVQQSNQLQTLIQGAKDAIANDTTMLQFEKQMADSQFTQRMNLLQYQRQNYEYMMNAAKDTYKTLMTDNPQGLLDSLKADPIQAQRFQQIMGVNLDTLQGMANTKLLQEQKGRYQLKTNSDGSQSVFDTVSGKIVGGASSGTGVTAVGSGTTEIKPTDQSVSNSILSATGLSMPAFLALTGQSSQLPRDKVTRSKAFAEAAAWANQHGVDISTMGSQYSAINQVVKDNIERANKTKVMAGEVAGSAEALAKVIDEKDLQPGFWGKLFGVGAFKPANLLALATGKQVNDPLTQKYATQLQAMTNDYAGYLAAARGSKEGPQLEDLRDAAQVVTNGLNTGSTQAFKDAVQANEAKVNAVVDKAVNDAQNSVWQIFGVTRPGQSTVTNFSAIDPNGTTHYFKDAESMNKFKQATGLQ